jgi:hypothetical protein
MIVYNLLPFHLAKKLYELGYSEKTEYSYPVTKEGNKYKNGPDRPFMDIDERSIDNTHISTFKCGTDFKENRLAAPTIWEAEEWLLAEYNILIDYHTYNSRKKFNSCNWIVDINKIPVMHGTKKRRLYSTKKEAIFAAIELVINKLISEKNG